MKYAKLLGLGLMVVALAATGCDKPAEPTKAPIGKEPEHTHGKGPNGGVMFDFGKVHGEFSVDHDKKECTVLVIGDDEKTPVPVAAKDFTVTTKASKTKEGKVVAAMTIKMLPKDEKGGKATKYVGTDPGLGNVADFEGTVLAEIDGKPSKGEFKE